MRTWFAVTAVVLQVFALGYMAGEREWIVRTGRIVWLRTAPIDPQDPMRGDYARLDYDVAHVHRRLWRDGLTNSSSPAQGGRAAEIPVYASLRLQPDGLAEVTALSDRRPSGLFLRGRLDPAMSWGEIKSMRYGLEAYFMEQGKALELEDERRQGVPLRMEVAVGPNGLSVLKGYRWEALGITVSFDTVRRTNQQSGFPMVQTIVTGAKVALRNHSNEPVAIVDLLENRSFGLVCDARWLEPPYQWVGETNEMPRPEGRDLVLLQPGESHTNRLDLTRPEWFVIDTRTNAVNRLPQALQELTQDWNSGFRIEYRPPSSDACEGLPNAKLIWHGHLRSRWFNPLGTVD